MNQDYTEREYKIARRKVNSKKAFYIHLSVYITVGLFLFALNIATGGNWWFHFPMLGWGIGITIHYFVIFGIPGVVSFEDGWEEKAIADELQKMKQMRGVTAEPELAEQQMELKALEKETSEKKKWDDSQIV